MAAKTEEPRPWGGKVQALYDDDNPDDRNRWYSGRNGGGMRLRSGRCAGLTMNEVGLYNLGFDYENDRAYLRYTAGMRRLVEVDYGNFIVPFGKYKLKKLCDLPNYTQSYWVWALDKTQLPLQYPTFFMAVRKFLANLPQNLYRSHLVHRAESGSDSESSTQTDPGELAAETDGSTIQNSNSDDDGFIVPDPETGDEDNMSVVCEPDPLEKAEQELRNRRKNKSRNSPQKSYSRHPESSKGSSPSKRRIIETDSEEEPEDVVEDEASNSGTSSQDSSSAESDAVVEDTALPEPPPYEGTFDQDAPDGGFPEWCYDKKAGGITLGFGRFKGSQMNRVGLNYLDYTHLLNKDKPWFDRYIKPYKRYRKGLAALVETEYKNFVVPFGRAYRGKRIGQVHDKKYLGWARQKRALLERYPLFFAAVKKFFENPHHQEVRRDIGERCDEYEYDLDLDADGYTPADAEQPDTDEDDFVVSDTNVEYEDNDEDSDSEKADKDVAFFMREQRSKTMSPEQAQGSKGKRKARPTKRRAKQLTVNADFIDDGDPESEGLEAGLSHKKTGKMQTWKTKIKLALPSAANYPTLSSRGKPIISPKRGGGKSESILDQLDREFTTNERYRASPVKTPEGKETATPRYETRSRSSPSKRRLPAEFPLDDLVMQSPSKRPRRQLVHSDSDEENM